MYEHLSGAFFCLFKKTIPERDRSYFTRIKRTGMSESIAWRSAALRAILYAALLALVSGGPRPEHRIPDHPQREQAEWNQRVQYPALNDVQRVQYPSLHDTQQVQFPSVDDGQRCAAGYYLDRSGQFARCVPCSCNGHSNECEQNTGRCLNCQDDTVGEHCERCREGYYSNAAQRKCRVCPCPLSNEANNFAVGCTEMNGRFQCLCKEGHTGERCERCATGYYGDPLVYGGRCRLCNCPGNLCDSKTGVCRNSLELQDTNTEEQCEECDNCAQTLLSDLEKLDVELRRIKNQLNLDTLRPSSKEHLRKLEEAITATTNLVNTFSFTVNNQMPKINQLERDVINLADDMDNLKEQARKRSEDSQKALAIAENSHQRAKDLDTEAQNLLTKIKELLKQLMDSNSSGAVLPSADLAKLLEQSENMVKDMEKRSFTNHKDAAKKEQAEANKFLEHVKNIIKQCDENEVASKRVDSLLSNYEAKLKELEDLLKQADNMVKKTSNQNNINTESFKDILKRVNDLESERDLVGDQIALAVNQLKDTEGLLNMFNDSKKEYEKLAAKLNGAKTELKDKVQVISQAAAKEKIVKQAEEHADNMYKLAKELQEAVQNVSGRSGVQTALSGIEAYKNITDAINAAEEAAKKAKEAADKALNDVSEGDLINRAENLKNNGNNLHKDAKNAAKDLKGATKDLKNQKDRLQDAERKKKELEKELLTVKDGLKGIQKDNIDNIILMAKEVAAAANRTTSDIMDQLNDINAEVNNISISPTVSNMDNVLNKVEMTVKNVSGSIPSLLDKIEELNSQIGSGNNVSENINKIKELIEQAREAANRIVVPMKFTGNGYVEMRPPLDLDDLRAYTSLNLSLQRPEKPPIRGDGTRRRREIQKDKDMFVLYLGNKVASGDFIGMALRNNILHFIYKLNGTEYDIETTSITESSSDMSFFDKIDLYRIYQDAQVNHTQQFTSTNPKPPQTKGNLGNLRNLKHNLLDLSLDDVVFYVGGYPDDFTPPASLNYGKYKGCIEFTAFNDKFISLYNFKKAVNINLETPCKRQIALISDSDYFEGTGYARIVLEKFPTKPWFQQKMETRAKDALLLYLFNETADVYYSVSLEKGYVVLRGREKDNILEPIKSVDKPSLSLETDVKLYFIVGKEFRVRVGNTEVKMTDGSLTSFNDFYIGGIPNTLRERYNITIPALKGCVKIGTVGGAVPVVKEKVGIGRGCSDNLVMIRKAEFNLGSALEKPHEDFSVDSLSLSLGFRSTESDGILLKNSKNNPIDNPIELYMEKGYVVLKFQDNMLKSTKQYQDGEWHYLTVVGQDQSIELRIDKEVVGPTKIKSSSGQYSSSSFLGNGNFKGCITNLYLRSPDSLYRAEDLSTYSSTGDVLLNTCSASQNM
ncbi:laminin subunit alpha-3 [Ctenopharyngodon idella]|uniref:laminin subunit alpha-3 n=1 Tax=Ctenopharyngodon idella TaxID=7959 RepID=UPI0022312B2E|nr:laminin subunit alpha-3 [Ctenopharyngodon idella]XP_051732205.1 laminin subunit alpha-3 [Ctenopharyngodon idella]